MKKKLEDLNKGKLVKIDIYSRANSINGKYRIAKLELDNLAPIKDSDIFFLETLKMRADLADKMFSEAKSQGRDINDESVIKEIGEEIISLGSPIRRHEAVMTAIFVALRLMTYYGVAISIWGGVFKKSFLVFGLYGLLAGFVISMLFVAPVIAFQRTKERIREMVFSVNAIWGNLGIILGVVALVALVIRIIFFN